MEDWKHEEGSHLPQTGNLRSERGRAGTRERWREAGGELEARI